MTQQPNKHFNTYKEGLDLEILRKYCEKHGSVLLSCGKQLGVDEYVQAGSL